MINHTHVCCWCSQNGEMFILHVTSYVDHLLPQFRVPNVDGSIFRFSHVSGEETSIVLYDNMYIYIYIFNIIQLYTYIYIYVNVYYGSPYDCPGLGPPSYKLVYKPHEL